MKKTMIFLSFFIAAFAAKVTAQEVDITNSISSTDCSVVVKLHAIDPTYNDACGDLLASGIYMGAFPVTVTDPCWITSGPGWLVETNPFACFWTPDGTFVWMDASVGFNCPSLCTQGFALSANDGNTYCYGPASSSGYTDNSSTHCGLDPFYVHVDWTLSSGIVYISIY